MRRLALILLALGFTIGLTTAGWAAGEATPEKDAETPTEIVWIDYDKGLVQAADEDRHIFINFTTSWCGWCKKMDATTFADSEVVKLFHEKFVTIKVDGDSKRELDIAGYKITEKMLTRQEFGVGSYPTYWFLDPAGDKLGAIKGYHSKEQLTQYLTFISEKQYEKDEEKAESEGGDK